MPEIGAHSQEGSPGWVYGQVEVIAFYGYNPIFGPGDSGGPMVAVDWSTGDMYAAGTISGGNWVGDGTYLPVCQEDQNRTCMNHGFFAPITRFLADNPGFTLMTS